jgi:hypothetical protein
VLQLQDNLLTRLQSLIERSEVGVIALVGKI